MQRNSIFSLILISLLLEWSLPAPLFPQAAFSTSKKSVERNFNKAAVAEGMKLSPEAIDSLRKYDLRLIQDTELAAAKSEVSPELTEGFTKAVISHLNQQKTVKKSDMDTAMVQAKTDEIHKMLPQEINNKALNSGITLTAEAQELIKTDMEVQTKRMAVSGLSQQEIQKRNEDYLAAVLAKAPKANVGGEEYHVMKNAIFCRLVKLSINTTPHDAEVMVSGISIGKTPIREKSFEPKKEYVFVFTKQGYKDSTQKYFVEGYPEKQQLDEILLKADK